MSTALSAPISPPSILSVASFQYRSPPNQAAIFLDEIHAVYPVFLHIDLPAGYGIKCLTPTRLFHRDRRRAGSILIYCGNSLHGADIRCGSNDIVVTAVDSWDNTATVTVTVVYTDAYSDQIADLQEQIEELLALLEELTGGDTDPETNLTALSEELASLRELLNSTADQLEEVSDRLDAIDDSDVAGSGASDAPSMATLMGVVAVAALLLLAVMIALYLNLRKMVREGTTSPEDSEEPPPPLQ